MESSRFATGGMTRKQFFWYLLLAASTIAAVVSLLTTAMGLERYISRMLAWLLAFAVQVGLFGMAWLMGASIHRLRGLVILLYCLTMPFSVVFSYVTLQSELAEKIKPKESQRALFDYTRRNVSEVGGVVSQAIGASDDIILRLNSWLEMERTSGWATQTCEEEENCYLSGVCQRIRDRISAWETRFNTTYREGPGEELIYGLLNTEVKAATRLKGRLESFRKHWDESGILDPRIDNRERLTRYDTALAIAPSDDIVAVLCTAFEPPQAPSYEDYSRDDIVSEEQPVYAFEDFLDLFSREYRMTPGDYPTVFAFLLALFIDLFVLFVAIGATLIEVRETDQVEYPGVQPIPPSWNRDVSRDIESWIDGSLLSQASDQKKRTEFLEHLIESIAFDQDGRALLIPKDKLQERFGFLLLKSRAASQELAGTRGGHPQLLFVLEDWVYPALATSFRSGDRPRT